MTHWLHWEEKPSKPDDQLIDYYAGCTFLLSKVDSGDSFSTRAEQYFEFSVEPTIDLSTIVVSFVQRGDSINTICMETHLDAREVIRLMQKTGTDPPPSWRKDFKNSNLNRLLKESGLSFKEAKRGPYGAATRTWDNGGGDNVWTNDTNWSDNAKPAAGDAVVFDGTSTASCTMDAVEGTFLTWTITTAYTGTITLNVNSVWSGALTIDFGGAGTFAGTSSITMTGAANLACDQTIPSLVINSGANTVTQTTNITAGAITVTGGTIAVVATTQTCNGAYSCTGTTTITTGTITIGGALVVAGTFGSNTAYTLDINASNSASGGTINAPTAAGAFTFSGATFISPTTFTHDNGTVTFDLAGTTTLGNASIQFGLITINSGATLDTSAASSFAFTTGGKTTVTGTLICNGSAITLASGSTSQIGLTVSAGGTFTGGTGTHIMSAITNTAGTGTITFTTGTTTINGTGASSIAWNMTSTSTLDFTTGTIAFTYGSGAQYFNEANNTARTFYNLTVNKANTNILQHANGTGMNITVGNNLLVTLGMFRIQEDTSLTARNLTVTGTTTINGDGIQVTTTSSAGTLTFNGTVTIATGAQMRFPSSGTAAHVLDMNANLLASAGTLYAPNASATFTYSGATFTSPTTFTHQSGIVTFDLAGTTTLGNASIQFNAVTVADGATLATSTYAITLAGNLIVGSGASGVLTTSTGTKTINGTTTINSGGSMGTATTTYTLDMNGNLLTSAGTLIAPQGAGSFTFSGATWNTPTTFTHSSGTVKFDKGATTTLGNDSIQFSTIDINTASTILDTSAASNYALSTGYIDVTNGTLACNNSTVNELTSAGVNVDASGVFTGGTGAHTFAYIISAGTYTATSGVTTITGAGTVFSITNTANFTHNSGTVTINPTSAGSAGVTITTASATLTFNNLSANADVAGRQISFAGNDSGAPTYAVAGNLVITKGAMGNTGTNFKFTVTGTTTISTAGAGVTSGFQPAVTRSPTFRL